LDAENVVGSIRTTVCVDGLDEFETQAMSSVIAIAGEPGHGTSGKFPSCVAADWLGHSTMIATPGRPPMLTLRKP
jgi:hypothetical protein